MYLVKYSVEKTDKVDCKLFKDGNNATILVLKLLNFTADKIDSTHKAIIHMSNGQKKKFSNQNKVVTVSKYDDTAYIVSDTGRLVKTTNTKLFQLAYAIHEDIKNNTKNTYQVYADKVWTLTAQVNVEDIFQFYGVAQYPNGYFNTAEIKFVKGQPVVKMGDTGSNLTDTVLNVAKKIYKAVNIIGD